MSFISSGGEKALFQLVKAANPTLPVKLNEDNCYFPKKTGIAEAATALLAGKYGTGVRGYRELKYTRLDLGKLFKNQVIKIGIVEPKPVFELLEDIYTATGYAFETTDLEPLAPPNGQTLPWRATLKAANTSFIYFGQAEVEFVKRPLRLSDIVFDREVDVNLQGVVDDGSRARAELFTFGIDYTSVGPVLAGLREGSLSWTDNTSPEHQKAETLITALNAIDRLPWKNVVGPNPWTVNGARIVYSGRVDSYDPTTLGIGDIRRPNQRYDRVLVVSFESDTTGATGFYGSAMFIHYNTESDNEVPNGAS